MKKTFINLVALFAVFVLGSVANAQSPVPGNYGYTNLSAGYGEEKTYGGVVKSEQIIDGNVIHVVWAKNSASYEVWYRRSNDLGKTWEEPVLVVGNAGRAVVRTERMMSVSSGKVFIVATTGNSKLSVFRTTDGKEFSETEVNSRINNSRYVNPMLFSVGSKVAVAYSKELDRDEGLHVAYSSDGGETFADSLLTVKFQGSSFVPAIQDFVFDGSRMVVLSTWSDRWGDQQLVFATVSDDYCHTYATTQLAPDVEDEGGNIRRHATIRRLDGPAVALDGGNIFVTLSAQLTADNSGRYLTVLRSADGGETWSEPKELVYKGDEDIRLDSKQPTIVARNGHIYVMTETWIDNRYHENGRGIFYSADNGDTFCMQDSWQEYTGCWGYSSNYTLKIDENDPTGNTAYALFNDFAWVKTTDGFKSVCEVTSSPNGRNDSNMQTQLAVDADGGRYWFLRYDPDNGAYYDLVYKSENEPEPSADNQCLQFTKKENNRFNRVAIPNASDLHADNACTVEMWVNLPELIGQTFAWLPGKEAEYANGLSFSASSSFSTGYKYRFISRIANSMGDVTELQQQYFDVTPNIWHHLALTYNAEQRRVRFYLDGVLQQEKEFSGQMGWGWNSFNLGNNRASDNTDFMLDDFRIWNRELTQDELVGNFQRRDFGGDESLLVNLNFDGTLRDITGNGHDGIGLYDVDFVASERSVPVADFETFVSETGEVSFGNRSENADTYKWSFGDGQTSTLAQPTHIFGKPGEYNVSLIASNPTAASAMVKSVTVAGLSGIEPRRAGNVNAVLATIMGGGINEKTDIKLVRGSNVIKATDVTLSSPGIVKALFNVDGAELGAWDVVAGNNTLTSGFIIEEARESKPWMTFQSRGKILYNQWLTHSISYGNTGNVDAYNVPLYFCITHYPELEVEFMDFDMEYPELDATEFTAEYIEEVHRHLDEEIGQYTLVTDDKGQQWRFYPFMAPIVKAGSSQTIHIRLKSPGDLDVKYWTEDGWGTTSFGSYDEDAYARAMAARAKANGQKPLRTSSKLSTAECMMDMIGMGVFETAVGLIPFGGCAWGAGKTVWQLFSSDKKDRMWNLGWNLASTAVSCGTSGLDTYAKISWTLSNSIGIGFGWLSAGASGNRCIQGPNSDDHIHATNAWDPNEMIGPSFYMDGDSTHWIRPDEGMPYTILFENKKEATAPAHKVFVTDTLDVKTLNLDDFAFTSVGWADTIVTIAGEKRTEFSVDVDMRPSQPLIVRASGKLDKETGIVNWMFVTLNPETLDEEEDPDLGFLVPNNEQHQGEGFVTFVVGQKPSLASGTRISNLASIVFDGNAPILTNNFVNAIDADRPQSAAYLLTEEGNQLKVQWSGSDASSGNAWYDVYYTTDGGETFTLAKTHEEGDYVLLDKEPNQFYGFYTKTIDHVGWTEDKEPKAEVSFDTNSINRLNKANGQSLMANGNMCDILLPRQYRAVTITIYTTDGRKVSQQSGNGQQFSVFIPTQGNNIVEVNADGERFVWKVAGK